VPSAFAIGDKDLPILIRYGNVVEEINDRSKHGSAGCIDRSIKIFFATTDVSWRLESWKLMFTHSLSNFDLIVADPRFG
jgi:hypothetical protein